jgi:hypothetical protein
MVTTSVIVETLVAARSRWSGVSVSAMDVASVVRALLLSHPCVRSVELIGSRAGPGVHELSDWDFAVETTDFGAVARDLHHLVAQLRPLAEQWDPYAPHACYMLILRGPTKIDLVFPHERREWSPPWSPTRETLEAIDRHFWDWILWLEQKRRGGRADVVGKSLANLCELLLRPLGVTDAPESVPAAAAAYLDARAELERRFGVRVPRDLEQEVRRAVG